MNDKKQMTEEEFLNHIGFESLEEYELSLKYEENEHNRLINEEAIKLGYKNAEEMYKEMESYGKYIDVYGNPQYNEDLAKINVEFKKNELIPPFSNETSKLYYKDDVKEGFDSKNFDDIFEKHYGVQEDRLYNIYYYLKHHLSYNRTSTIKHHFKKEIDAIENFMTIENINVNYETSDYRIPFLKAERNYTETYECLKTFIPRLLKVLANYGVIMNHDRYLFKSDFALHHERKRLEPIIDAYNKIKFVKRTNGFELLAKIITKSDDINYIKGTSLVLYHWIWSIKYKMRKFLNIESPLDKIKDYSSNLNPFAPVLYGGQGIGKSVLITKLTQPLKESGIVQDTTTKDLFEAYSFDLTSKYFILTLDDLATIKEENVPDFKRMITGDSRTGRQKGDQASKTFKSRAVFILGSNIPVDEVIQDETGNRRFFQINSPSPFYNEILDLDFLPFWQSVDENSPPITEDDIKRFITPYQFKNKRKSRQEEFIQEFNLCSVPFNKTDPNKKYFEVPTSTLAKIYTEWGGFKINVYGKAYKDLITLLKTDSHSISINGYKQKVILFEDSCTYEFVTYLTKYKTRNK